MARVELKDVVKTYPGKVTAVHSFTLDIADGEFVVFVGPSGCGKSTTLRMIAGLEEITGGTISIDGRVVNDVHPKDRDIAMVFQNYALYPHMTVRENMALALKLRKVPKEEISRRVGEAARMLGLEPYLDRKPKALSGGQRQRVAVGRAIVREPKAFLFDEPLSNLDAKLRITTRAELKALHARLKTTTVYVTHDQEEAMTLGDRIVVMSAGRIQQVAPPLVVYRRPVNRFVAAFVGTPPMNFIPGSLAREGGSVVFTENGPGGARLRLPGEMSAKLASVSGAVTLGLRPQALHAAPGPGREPISVSVSVTEPLGDAVDCTANTAAGTRVVARVDALADIHAGRNATLHADLTHAHVFAEGEFGANLTL